MADNDTTTSSPAVEIKRSWGDEAEEEEPDTPSTSDDKTTSDLKLDSLSIHDTKKLHNFLDDPQDSNIKAVTAGDTLYISAKTFEELNLSADLLKGLYVEMKFERPSKIQTISLPMILTPPYKHLIAQAHNGSGKTTCFVLGMLSRVDPKLTAPQALCICPTRELAIQNMEVLKKMGNYTGITSECAIPMDSSNYVPISKRAPVTAQVVIGTPGTINKWVTAKKLSTNYLKILVFDEADHMLAESGFKDDSVRIMKAIVRCNPDCQVLLFSATFDDAVRAFVSKIVTDLFKGDYNQMFVNKEDLSLESVKQYKVKCPDELSKIMVIKDKIFELGQKVGQTIIFVRTRNSASTLHKTIAHDGYEVTTIQGALRQEDRDKIVKEFKDGLTQVLISTDLLARGFDQSQVNLVVNFDLPVKHEFPSEPDCEVYLHRVGRAGRFGRKGAVFNLLCNDRDDMIMSKIERHFNMEVAEVPSWRSNEDFEAALKKAEAFKEEGGMGGVIHVGGKVLCQDCSQGWNEWVHGAKPIKGCKVSITCMDERKRVIYYGSDETDEAGDYEMTLNKYINGGKQLDPNKCSVRLVSSPDPVCDIATDFAGGRSGVKLRRPTVVYRDFIKHVLSPLYYTTPMCDEPDAATTTTRSSSSYAKQTKY